MSEAATARKRTPMDYDLVEVTFDEDGAPIKWERVSPPDGVKDRKRRDQYKRAVKAVLEDAQDGEAVSRYNDKHLTVISYPKPFIFSAKVKEETIRTVEITEG